MKAKYEVGIYLFLSLYRFFAYSLAVVLMQVVPLRMGVPPFETYLLLISMGVYTLFKVLGPLRWWQRDPMTYVVLIGDLVLCTTVLFLTGGLNSGFLLYSFLPVITAGLLFEERLALITAGLTSLTLVVAHLGLSQWSPTFASVMEGNYLLWLIVYIITSFLVATMPYRINLNIRLRIEQEAILSERRRMRQELHDGLAQSLTYLTMKAEAVNRCLSAGDLPQARKEADEIRRLSRETYRDMRDSLDQLSLEPSPALAIPTLADYVREFGKRSGIEAHFHAPPGPLPLTPVAQLQMVRIAQEALANVRRHSQASRVWVTLTHHPQEVELSVKDNGQGFLPEQSPSDDTGYHGLQVMQERAQGLGGRLAILSAPGKGTEVRLTLPKGKGGT